MKTNLSFSLFCSGIAPTITITLFMLILTACGGAQSVKVSQEEESLSFSSSKFVGIEGGSNLVTQDKNVNGAELVASINAPEQQLVELMGKTKETTAPPTAAAREGIVAYDMSEGQIVRVVDSSAAIVKAKYVSDTETLAPSIRLRRQPIVLGGGKSPGSTAATPGFVTPRGSAVYYIPKQMIEKEASLVDLWIDRTTSIDKLRQELAAKLQITADKIKIRNVHDVTGGKAGSSVLAKIDGVTIPIGGSMIAQLRGGDDFSIEPKEPVPQPLHDEVRAKWNWRVTPKHASVNGMLLDLDIWIDPGPGKRLIDSYHESVIVEAIPIPWYEKLYKIMQGINGWLALFGISGLGGVFTWLLKRNK